jgi:hypothetical protein
MSRPEERGSESEAGWELMIPRENDIEKIPQTFLRLHGSVADMAEPAIIRPK